ncbi:MAG: universal stress protein [Myxococcota bacterium]
MPYEHIVVASDFSEASLEAYRYAATLALACGGRVTVLHVDDTVRGDEAQSSRRPSREEDAEHARRALEALGVPATVEVIPGSPKRAIDAWVREHGGDLVVVTQHDGRSVRGERRLGDTCLGMLMLSDVPVLVVDADAAALPPDAPTSLPAISRILVPVDFSTQSAAALVRVAELAGRLGATISALHVIDVPYPPAFSNAEAAAAGIQSRLDEARLDALFRLEDLSARHLRRGFKTDVRTGRNPSTVIMEAAREEGIDLVAIASTGRGAVARMVLGRTSRRVAQLCDRPVLVFPAASLDAGGVV